MQAASEAKSAMAWHGMAWHGPESAGGKSMRRDGHPTPVSAGQDGTCALWKTRQHRVQIWFILGLHGQHPRTVQMSMSPS